FSIVAAPLIAPLADALFKVLQDVANDQLAKMKQHNPGMPDVKLQIGKQVQPTEKKAQADGAKPKEQPLTKKSEPVKTASEQPQKKEATQPSKSSQRVRKGALTLISQIYRLDKGTFRAVSADESFKSGDKIILSVVTNSPGILNVTTVGSTGSTSTLAATSFKGPGGIFVPQADQKRIIEFDNTPGVEIIDLPGSRRSPSHEGWLPGRAYAATS